MATKKQRRQQTKKRKPKPKPKPIKLLNHAKVGLEKDCNQDLAPKKPRIAPVVDQVKWVSIPPKPSSPRPISEADFKYISNLIQKHGTDYEKMFRDRKLNYDQLTIAQLQKLERKMNERSEGESEL